MWVRGLLRGVMLGGVLAGAVVMVGAGAQPGSSPAGPVEMRVASVATYPGIPAAYRMTFSWRNTATNAAWLYVYAPSASTPSGGSRFTLLPPMSTEFTLGPVGSGSYQCLIVIAGNAAGYSSWSNWACAVTPDDQIAPPPARPRGPPATVPPAAETGR